MQSLMTEDEQLRLCILDVSATKLEGIERFEMARYSFMEIIKKTEQKTVKINKVTNSKQGTKEIKQKNQCNYQ